MAGGPAYLGLFLAENVLSEHYFWFLIDSLFQPIDEMRRLTQQESVASGNDIELRTTASAVDNPANNFHSAFPEGGRDAYLCLLGSALILFPSFGFQVASKCGSHQILILQC